MSDTIPDACAEIEVLEVRMRLAIRIFDFRPQERLVLDFLVDRTYSRGVERTLLPSLDYVVKLCRMLKADASAVLRRLEEEYFVIGSGPAPEYRSRSFQDPRWYWFLPNVQNWRSVMPRVDREAAAQMHRDLDYIEASQGRLSMPDGSEFGPQEMPGLKAEIAASSRADALQDERQRMETTRQATRPGLAPGGATDGPDVCGNSAHVGVGKFRTHTENPNTSATCREIPNTSLLSTSRAPVPACEHEHAYEHGTPAVPQHMFHVHKHARSVADGDEALRALSNAELGDRLDEESRYALDLLEGIVGEAASKFHRTWLLRLNDRWKGHALDAIGEVKRRHTEGVACRLGWGETANDLFHRYKKAAGAEKKTGKPTS